MSNSSVKIPTALLLQEQEVANGAGVTLTPIGREVNVVRGTAPVR
jgi:hypothetical protein